ncbi:bifunctional diguanylate cyclase/phosphodiesterase [Allorhizobium taibaishanense]|uniref:Diguanylate cyclase n=1 Tax=Allorhizobium taibaishanense TaxID=887144 RepID=A0A1Q9A9L2_9HYPH|nr:GGDEF domain-containing protein [Allorhizobium taibaishanense]MBB4009898.1 diguanylate cyclase (GGDEF)-like protein [Allorhizobium taibaishanense]OLP51527.1 diguanylate cyclase [Allorhizobium taibaishanense]
MLIKLQNKILEKIAKGEPLAETVDYLCRTVEAMVDDTVCSVLTLDDFGRLHHLSGPSIPKHYAQAIDGLCSGEGVGSCGTAAHRGEPVIVTDIETHPYWAAFKGLALPLGFLACWSTPIISGGKVLGTFAFYFRKKRGPSEVEQSIVSACVHLCAIGLEREMRLEERRRLAFTDVLTGLPNRTGFNETVINEDVTRNPWGLLLIDLDNLKQVNDTFGHQAGDDLIRTVGKRLQRMSGSDTAFRLGGDEFAVIVRGTDCVDLGYHAAYVLAALKEPCLCAGQTVYPAGTIGGAIARKDQTVDEVRQNADFALYEAKERCRGQFIEYTAGSGSKIAKRFRSFQQVSEALRERRIKTHYQPVVDLATGTPIGFEALSRLATRNGDIVSASHFHEATTDVHLACALTACVLDNIARDARDWLDRGLEFGKIGLNVSAGDFLDGNLAQRIVGAMEGAGISPDRIVVELTESIYLGNRERMVIDQIKQIREAGMLVALDDFGTGFASMTHLLTVPLDIIKIDRSFIARLLVEQPALVIVEGLLAMSKSLNIRVIAEGIETEEQRNLLMGMGCSQGQGYLFSKALSRDRVTSMMSHRRSGQTHGYGAGELPLFSLSASQ